MQSDTRRERVLQRISTTINVFELYSNMSSAFDVADAHGLPALKDAAEVKVHPRCRVWSQDPPSMFPTLCRSSPSDCTTEIKRKSLGIVTEKLTFLRNFRIKGASVFRAGKFQSLFCN